MYHPNPTRNWNHPVKSVQEFLSKPSPDATELDLTGRDFVVTMLDSETREPSGSFEVLHSQNHLKPKGRRNTKFLNRNSVAIELHLQLPRRQDKETTMSNLMEDLIVPDPPEEVVDALESEGGEHSAANPADEHPKKKAAKRKATRKAAKQPKTAPKRSAKPKPVDKDASSAKNSADTHCSICGRALSKPTSTDQGMGDVCAGRHQKLNALGVDSMQEHLENNTVLELPDGYMKVKDAHAEVIRTKKNHGISGHRFIQAFGGNGLLLPPFNEHFKVVFYKGTRYIPASCLNYLDDLRKV